MIKSPRLRRFLLLDACCALASGLIYVLFFDVLTGTLGLPVALANFQLTANWVYACMGFVFYFTRSVDTGRALILIIRMNVMYAGICAVAGTWLLLTSRPLGTGLLFLEGLAIVGLALMERRALFRELPTRSAKPLHLV